MPFSKKGSSHYTVTTKRLKLPSETAFTVLHMYKKQNRLHSGAFSEESHTIVTHMVSLFLCTKLLMYGHYF